MNKQSFNHTILLMCLLLLISVFFIGCNHLSDNDKISDDVVVSGIINGQEIVILDVRTSGEYNSDHIPEAINIPLNDLRNNVSSIIPDENKPIVVYCQSGNRSQKAVKVLKDLGYKNVYDYGSIKNWPGDLVMEKPA